MIRLPPKSTLFPYPTLFRSGDEVDLQLVEQPASEVLLGDAGAAADRDVPVAGRRPRLLERRLHALGDERERRSSLLRHRLPRDRKSTRLNSSHANISYAVFC